MTIPTPYHHLTASELDRNPQLRYARSWWEQHGRYIAKAVDSPNRSVTLQGGRRLRFPPAAEIAGPAEAAAWARLARAQGMLLRSSWRYSPGSVSILSAILTGALISVWFSIVTGDVDIDVSALALVVVGAGIAGVVAILLTIRASKVDTWEARAFEYQFLADWWYVSPGCRSTTLSDAAAPEPNDEPAPPVQTGSDPRGPDGA